MKRRSTAVWTGSGKEGSGKLVAQSKVLNNAAYSWKSRFADGEGTNPEELLAAAHAGCFSMKLSFLIGDAGFVPSSIETSSDVTIEDGSIKSSHLTVKAEVPGMTKEAFQKCAEDAKANCPMSKALKIDITMEATLS